MRLFTTLIASLLFTSAAQASEFTPQNTVIINTVIDRSSMQDVIGAVEDMATRETAPESLNIIIDSPGGSVFTGFKFIAAIKELKARGTSVDCYVTGLAASMAFHILTQCDNRTVLNESALLWHRARVMLGGLFGEPMTAPQAAALARDLIAVDDLILTALIKSVGKSMPAEDVAYHFEHETLHIGSNLCAQAKGFCKSVDSIPGALAAIRNKKIVHAQQRMSPFDQLEDRIIYILPQFMIGVSP